MKVGYRTNKVTTMCRLCYNRGIGTHNNTQPTSFVDSTRIGVAVLSGFSILWAVAVLSFSSFTTLQGTALFSATVLFAVTLNVIAARRRFKPVDDIELPYNAATRQRIFIITNVVQAILFSVTISVCLAFALFAYIPLIGAIIVGLHFIPLAKIFAERSFLIVGLVMTLAGAIGLALALIDTLTAHTAVAYVGSANIVTLLSAAYVQIHLYGNRK